MMYELVLTFATSCYVFGGVTSTVVVFPPMQERPFMPPPVTTVHTVCEGQGALVVGTYSSFKACMRKVAQASESSADLICREAR